MQEKPVEQSAQSTGAPGMSTGREVEVKIMMLAQSKLNMMSRKVLQGVGVLANLSNTTDQFIHTLWNTLQQHKSGLWHHSWRWVCLTQSMM